MNSHSSKPKKLVKSSRPIRFSRILSTTQQSIENISVQFKRNKSQDNQCFSYKCLRTFNDKSSSTLVFLLKKHLNLKEQFLINNFHQYGGTTQSIQCSKQRDKNNPILFCYLVPIKRSQYKGCTKVAPSRLLAPNSFYKNFPAAFLFKLNLVKSCDKC